MQSLEDTNKQLEHQLSEIRSMTNTHRNQPGDSPQPNDIPNIPVQNRFAPLLTEGAHALEAEGGSQDGPREQTITEAVVMADQVTKAEDDAKNEENETGLTLNSGITRIAGSREKTHQTSGHEESVSQTTKEVLIITDSTGRDLDGRRLGRNMSVFVKKLHRGKDVADAKDYISRTGLTANRIILNVGTNNLARGDEMDTKSQILDLVKCTQKKFPNSKILVSPILPRIFDAHFNNMARKLNASLKVLVDGMEKCETVKLEELWETPNRRTHYQSDGIHLSRVGTSALARGLKAALGLYNPDTAGTNFRRWPQVQQPLLDRQQRNRLQEQTATTHQHHRTNRGIQARWNQPSGKRQPMAPLSQCAGFETHNSRTYMTHGSRDTPNNFNHRNRDTQPSTANHRDLQPCDTHRKTPEDKQSAFIEAMTKIVKDFMK